MNVLFKSTEIVSYFLWEYTKHINALDLWYCGEDIALYLEKEDILCMDELDEYRLADKRSDKYVEFLRNIAFRVYIFTKQDNADFNWYASEKLLKNREWDESILAMANAYREMRASKSKDISFVRSQDIRKDLKN